MERTLKEKLLIKTVDPKHNDRIVQWIRWNHLAKTEPSQYKLKRNGRDFFLMAKHKYYPYSWYIRAYCIAEDITERLKLVD